MKVLHINSDGACRGNPGPAAVGVVIRSGSDVVREISEPIGPATNNIAEYRAFIRGLQEARDLGADEVVIRTDSELLYFQLRGTYKVRHEHIRPLYAEAVALLKGFRKAECQVVPREENRDADRLATAALREDKGPGQDGRSATFVVGEESPGSGG